MENSTDELKCFLKFLSKWDNNCTSVESLQWEDPSCLKESNGNICECLIQVLRVQKTCWVRLYFMWSGSVPKSNEITEEAKDMLYVDTYPLWHLNFLGSSTHHEMWASETRYTHIWILDYAVIAKRDVDAADEKNLLPMHGNIHYYWNAFAFFKNWLAIHQNFFFFRVHVGIATYILAFSLCEEIIVFICWENENYLIGLFWHMWQIIPSPLVTEWVSLDWTSHFVMEWAGNSFLKQSENELKLKKKIKMSSAVCIMACFCSMAVPANSAGSS